MQQELVVVGVSLQGLRPLISRADAKAQGLKTYFTGVACGYGHLADRITSNTGCRVCVNLNTKKFKAKNPTKHSAESKKYYQENKERLAVAKCTRRRTDVAWVAKEAAEAAQRRKANPALFAIRGQEWRKANVDRCNSNAQRWRKENPGRVAANKANRRARKARATPSWADLAAVKKIYDLSAAITKLTGVQHEVDHIYPLHGRLVSGLHVGSNLQVLTKVENNKKRNKYDPMTGI